MNANLKYYKVTCKCGHVGRRYYIPITFPIMANSKSEAASIGRTEPRCKHHHKDCVLDVEECSYEEFFHQKQINNHNPYLRCKCIQDQNLLDIDDMLIEDPHYQEKTEIRRKVEEEIHPVYYKKQKVRNPKKMVKDMYITKNDFMEDEMYE